MTSKRQQTNAPATVTAKSVKSQPLILSQSAGESNESGLARHVAGATLNATQSIVRLHGGTVAGESLDCTALMAELQRQADDVNSGKLARGEAMLTSQAHTLDALFHALIGKAVTHRDMAPYETLLRLALKAQSHCRSTWEAIAEIKNPRAVFVKQANIANGHQQINNAGAREIDNSPTKLLETTRNEWMDTRTTCTTGRSNQALEAVGAINGTAQ